MRWFAFFLCWFLKKDILKSKSDNGVFYLPLPLFLFA